MPIFEFECENGHIVEKYFRSSVPDIATYLQHGHCRVCHAKLVRKVQSNVSTPQFKGDGFYATDYKKEK